MTIAEHKKSGIAPRSMQIPPNTALTFLTGNHDSLRVVATGDMDVGPYKAFTEYWCPQPTFAVGATNMSLTVVQGHMSLEQIEAFLKGYDQAIVWPEAPNWQEGAYEPPVGTLARLYRADDPDDPTGRAKIGLVLTQDPKQGLTSAAWYKGEKGGNIWNVKIIAPIPWELVVDDAGRPTVDPKFLDPNDPGKLWYFAASDRSAAARYR